MDDMRKSILLACLIPTLALAGCQSKAPAPDAHPDHDHQAHLAASTQDAADEAPVEAAGPRIETDSFVLEVASTEPRYRVGKSGQLAIELEGRGKWHVNQDYPIRVNLSGAPGVGLEQAELVKQDAKVFTEDEVRFETAVEPSQTGDHEVACEVSFAMCTDENCVLEKRTVAMQVKVE
jgi:hypothetical protein